MTDGQIRYLVDRFLGWKLPENFNPDCGISFKRTHSEHGSFGPQKYEPTGTNLFDATQATEMVRHMIDGMSGHGKPDGAVRELIEAIATAEQMVSEHIEEFHDFDYEPDQVPHELAQLRDIQHHLAGSLIGEDGVALSSKIAAAETSPGDAYREVIDEALIVRHLGVAKGNAKAELNQILDWDVAAALDPAVSGRKA